MDFLPGAIMRKPKASPKRRAWRSDRKAERPQGAVGTLHAGDSVVLPGTLRRAYRVVTEATRVLEVFLPLADDSSGAVAPAAPAAGANGARL